MFTDLVVASPSTSVAVMMTSYHVSADASPVVGMVNDPVGPLSGPRNGWTCVPWWNRTSVVNAAVARVRPAKSTADAPYVMVSPARYSAPFVGAETMRVGGTPTWMVIGVAAVWLTPSETVRRTG